ncbi:MAG: nitroreductase family protein [bacterium JZ-2024 1]
MNYGGEKMDFWEVLKKRRSVRAYQKQTVEEEKIHQLLEAMNSAPSAGDLQAYEVVLIRDAEKKKALAHAAYDQIFIVEAPVVFVFFAHPKRSSWRYGKRGSQLYCVQDGTIACAYMQLAAVALGLSSCWVGAFDDAEVCQICKAPPNVFPIAILTVGYPAESPPPTPRRLLKDLVRVEQF